MMIMRVRLRYAGINHQRHWATLPVAVVRLGRPTPTPVDIALGRGEPDLLGLPMQRQVDEVIGQLSLFRPEAVAERDFLRVHRARGAAGHQSIPAVSGKLLFSHALRAALYGLFFHAAVHRFLPDTEGILARSCFLLFVSSIGSPEVWHWQTA